MTDERAHWAHRTHHGLARPAVLVATAVLIIAGLLSADLETSTEPAWALMTHSGSAAAVVGPPPGTAVVLDAVVSAEHQIISLSAYTDAQAYLKLAESDARTATAIFDRALARWRAAKTALAQAVAVQSEDRQTVELYEQALYELGIAEYTGVSVQSNLSLPSQENQVEQNELGSIAASDTSDGLQQAQIALANITAAVRADRAVLAWATVVAAAKRALLKKATAQLDVSRADLVLARKWVLVPGLAPDLPAQALALLEGKVAVQYRQDQLLALGRAAAGRAKSDAGLTETAVDPGAPGLAAPITSSTTTTSTTTSTTTTPMATTAVTAPPAAPGVLAEVREAAMSGLAAYGPHILGNSLLSAAQIEGWFESTGAVARTTVPLSELVADYIEAGRLTGVRADLAFAQSVVETGYFSFPPGGQLVPKNNNFAGIGACDKCKHGWSFPSAMAGVLGQEGLLAQYAGGPVVPGAIGAGGVYACCTTWMSLAGVWATNPGYGYEILSVYKEMLAWALAQEEQQAGLLPAASPATTPASVSTSGGVSPSPSG